MTKVTLEMARAKVNLSQEEMAKRLGTNRVTYGNYEKYRTPMRIDVASRFSDIVGIKMDDIIFLKENYTSSVVS